MMTGITVALAWPYEAGRHRLGFAGRMGCLPPILAGTMRLNTDERAAVERAARRFLLAGSRVSLFGSRTDDNRRGGDIDLLVEMPALRSAADVIASARQQAIELVQV